LTGDAVANYLKQVEEWIHQETDRCHCQRGYLDPDTQRELIDVIYTECIRKYYEILAAAAKELLEKERMEDIHRMYHMFGQLSTLNGLNALKNEFSEFVKDQGWQIVGDTARDNEMIASLLEFKERLNLMLQNALGQSDLFVNAMREAFESFVNKRPNKPAELLAKHIDTLLKTGKSSSESEIEKTLDACLGLFRFLRGKDVFEAFYKKDLAKRLLLGKSSNWDTEKHVLAKLKTGKGFV
jgi:cullin-4